VLPARAIANPDELFAGKIGLLTFWYPSDGGVVLIAFASRFSDLAFMGTFVAITRGH
jgi:hypothetical protein